MCCSGYCPAPKTLAGMVVLAETSHRLPRAAGQGPAIVPDWPGGAMVITRQTVHLVAQVCLSLLFTSSTCSDWSGARPTVS